ncbi:MAG: NIPSNAP family protein [Alphaproteobacteria bacterium]
MIYQHRVVIARGGKLEARHQAFQETALAKLDDYGSRLIGAWEVYIGEEAGSAVWQLRQFESLAVWEQHQDRVRADTAMESARAGKLYPQLDQINTSILRLSTASPALPVEWPDFDAVRGQNRGWIEQRFLNVKLGTLARHHEFYAEKMADALAYEGAELLGLFDTVIGQGTTNGNSQRAVELRRFPGLASWQRWRERQDTNPALAKLVKSDWLGQIERVDSQLLRPLDYSRIR